MSYGWDNGAQGSHPPQGRPGPGYGPEPQRGGSGAVIAVIAVLAVLALALLGAIAYLVLRPGGGAGDGSGQVAASSLSSSPAATSQPPVTETAFTTAPERETVTVTREAPLPRTPRSAGYPAGADSSGWVDNAQSRCNAGDPATMIGRTTQASFSICVNPDNGRFYYRGSAGGAGVEVDDPAVSGGSAMVANNDVLYSIDSSGMRIYQGGDLISSQPMVSFWAD
ncbi:hypothetical protein [Dietzia sp. MNB45]|uniref:hypothetical protein n=1 Tax=Dietzia sp. MNB45 TaxID=3238800 RepID=UPI003F7D7C25